MHRLGPVALVALSAAVLTGGLAIGCSNDEDSGVRITTPQNRGERGESCRARNDCEDGLACVRNVCVLDEFPISPTARMCDIVECTTAGDCVRIADGCDDLQDACADGDAESCAQFETRCNFVCESNRCESRCAEDGDCPGGRCRDGICVQCVENGDCRDDERCVRGQCVEPCIDDLACPLFHSCVDGECVDTGCRVDRECVALLRNVDARCLEGTCTAPCITDSDCDDPDDYDFMKCVSGQCQHVGCETDDECRARLYGAEPVQADVIDVVCREGP